MTGIYKILNSINGNFYIGSAININRRFNEHRSRLRNNISKQLILQNAWNKYGKESFVFEILENCEKDLLNNREQFYLDTLNPEYNIRKIAENNRGWKWSAETRKKQEASYKIKGNKVSKKLTGRIQPKEEIEKRRLTMIKLGMKPNLGRKFSEDTKQKMKESQQKRRLKELIDE